MLYVLMYPVFTPKDRAQIDLYRAAYEPEHAKIVAPHVTLVFGVKNISEQALIQLCQKVALLQGAFEVSFDRLRSEPDLMDGSHKCYLDIGVGGETVRRLHQALYDGPHIGEYNHEILFVPHMTVATSDDEGRSGIARDAARRFTLPFRGQVRGLSVMRLADEKLENLTEVELTG